MQIYRTDLTKPKLVTSFLTTRFRKTARWDGMIGGKPAPDGIYAITITTYDRAGNAGSFPRVLPPTITADTLVVVAPPESLKVGESLLVPPLIVNTAGEAPLLKTPPERIASALFLTHSSDDCVHALIE